MISSEDAISYIKTNLIGLVESGKMKGVYQQSTNTISFYVYRNATEEIPLLTLRTSDHRPKFQKCINPNNPMPSEIDNTYLSIEFYNPKFDAKGNKIRNRMENGINIPEGVNVPKPFTISSFSYLPQKLDMDDVEVIYKSILEWIFTQPRQPFRDPFVNTDKEAIQQRLPI